MNSLPLPLTTTGLDVSHFVTFTPAQPHQHLRWRVLGEPKAGAKGYARFNGRVGTLIGTLEVTHAHGYACVLDVDGTVETFAPQALAPELDRG